MFDFLPEYIFYYFHYRINDDDHQIRDGGNSGAPLLANLCGWALPDSVTSSGNRLWMRFKPSRMPQRGYDITYTSTDQGSVVLLFSARGH